MPTRNRRTFIPAAIETFLSQDWANKELIIVDDGDSVRDLATHPLVRYTANGVGKVIGEKRNIACQLARGEYIVHWDDDDWYGPNRISEQVRILRQSSRPATGYNILPFAWDEGRRAWLYQGTQGYACGASLCYLRSYWAGHRFEHVHIGEDNRFIKKIGARFLSWSGNSIVARIHGGNTCERITMLTGATGTGGNERWREIDYGQLSRCGYPVLQAVLCSRDEEPEDDCSRDSSDHRGLEVGVERADRVRSGGRAHRTRRRARGGCGDGGEKRAEN
jgi:glycosyltransferase involved in cell wall biosynthesis